MAGEEQPAAPAAGEEQPAAPAAGTYDPAMLNTIIQRLMQQPAPPQPVAQPSSTEGRGALSLLGEAIGGGQQYGTTQQREAAGLRALQSMGMNMMANSGYAPVRTPFGQILASGMQGAQQSLGESQSVEAAQMAAQQDWAQKQQEMNLQRLKVALPLLTLQTQMQQAAAARNLASGSGGPNTSISAVASPAFTGDLEKDRQIIAQRESGGDPTALNWVARADPSAYGRGATASGKYQFVNSTWQDGLKLAGLDPSKYPTAMSAPESVQDQVFTAVYKRDGTKPWDASTFKQNWVPTPTGQMVLANVVPGTKTAPATAAAPPAAPAPYKVASTGAIPPPPSGAPTAPATTDLPVPPIPPTTAPVGNLGLVKNPDGSVGTPGGGFRSTVAPPGTPAPQQTAQTDQPPAPTVTPPTPSTVQPNPDIKAGDLTIRHPGTFADYRASQYVPPTGEDFNPNLTPPQLAAFAARRQQVDFDRQNIANLPFAQQPEAVAKWKAEDAALTADQQNAAQAKAQAAAAAKTKYDETQQKDIQQRYTDQATAYTTAAHAQLAAKNKMQENEQTSNLASKQKVLEGLDTEATSAHENLTQLQMVKELSDAAGQPGVLASYPELRSWLVKTGVATDAQAQQWSAQQALDAAANRLTLAMRSGSGMSRLTNMDLQFLQHASPQSFNPQDWRDAQIAYLMNTYQRQQQFTGLVHRGVADGMSLTDAQATADKELGPTIKQTPTTDANGAPLMPVDRDRWNWDNLMPGSFYKNPSGNLKIFKPKPDAIRP